MLKRKWKQAVVEFIAERRVAAVSPDGEKLVLRIAVGQPYQVDEDSWACPVSIEGFMSSCVMPSGTIPGRP